ncbi:MAG: DUF5333 family protein [Pseudomonadota bacterium]
MRAFPPALALVLLSGLAIAQDEPVPDYFVIAVFDVSTAQTLARSCATLSVDPVLAARQTEAVLAQLTEDGYTPENIQARMADPSEAIGRLQRDFMDRHGLSTGAAEEAVCAAGQKEIAEGTGVGALLLEVSE